MYYERLLAVLCRRSATAARTRIGSVVEFRSDPVVRSAPGIRRCRIKMAD
jgi:hypothetical protein